MRHLITTSLFAIISIACFAQQKSYLIQILDKNNNISRSLKGKADSLKFKKIVKKEYDRLIGKGYVLATIKQSASDSLWKCKITKGAIYQWGRFNIDAVPEALLSRAGYHIKQFENARVNTQVLGELMVKIIKESDKTGYPFAVAKLDSVIILNDEIMATLTYTAGQQIKYGVLELDSDFIKAEFLASYLTIKEGDFFNSNNIVNISKKIKNLSYCKLTELPKVRFEHKSCIITLSLESVKANKVDAILGLAPNQIEESKLLVTGYANFDLHNLFRAGKQLTFNWRQFGVQSQRLKAMYNHTNLFGSVINTKGEFELFKQDTTFINRSFNLDIGFNEGSYVVNFTSNFIASRLLSATTATDLNKIELIDFNAQFYGVEFFKNEFDNVINPQKGWSLQTGLNIGAKNIVKSSFVSAEVYDSLKLQSLQGSFNATADLAIPVSKLMVAYSKLEMGTIISNGKLFGNDLFRLGGVNSIRGFNELEIYASSFAMLQVEARLLLGENSRLFGFIDLAYVDNQVIQYNDTFLGLGTGLLLDTPSGVIQLVYAVGKSSKQSLSLAESKIHVGYVARF